MKEDQEFWIAFIIYGGIILAGSLISIAILGVALNKNFFKRKKTIIKELYEEKERKNGQEKGGSRGSY